MSPPKHRKPFYVDVVKYIHYFPGLNMELILIVLFAIKCFLYMTCTTEGIFETKDIYKMLRIKYWRFYTFFFLIISWKINFWQSKFLDGINQAELNWNKPPQVQEMVKNLIQDDLNRINCG